MQLSASCTPGRWTRGCVLFQDLFPHSTVRKFATLKILIFCSPTIVLAAVTDTQVSVLNVRLKEVSVKIGAISSFSRKMSIHPETRSIGLLLHSDGKQSQEQRLNFDIAHVLKYNIGEPFLKRYHLSLQELTKSSNCLLIILKLSVKTVIGIQFSVTNTHQWPAFLSEFRAVVN